MKKLILTLLLCSFAGLIFAQGELDEKLGGELLFSWNLSQPAEKLLIKPSHGNFVAKLSKPAKQQSGVLTLDGKTKLSVPKLNGDQLPGKKFTVESWVNISKHSKRSGLCGLLLENGRQKSGWMLGSHGRNFSLTLHTNDRTRKIPVIKTFEQVKLNTWYHLVATYDGTEACLYLNGHLVNFKEFRGEVIYPKAGSFSMGELPQGDKSIATPCKLKSLSIFDYALSEKEILQRFESSKETNAKPSK